MPFVVVAPAVIGAAATVYSSDQSASAAKSAASTQAAAADQAAQMQMQQYQQTQNEYAPQRALGTGADSLLAQLYGINLGGSVDASQNPGGAVPSSTYNPIAGASGGAAGGSGTGALNGPAGTVNPNFSSFYNSPGYQFSLQQGENTINRSAAAQGNAYSTSTMAGLDQFAQGTASTQYNSYVNQLLQQAGLGSAATAGTASAGTAAAEGASNSVISAGNANASGILGAAGANANAISSIGNNPAIGNAFQQYQQTSDGVASVSAAENSGQYSLENALG